MAILPSKTNFSNGDVLDANIINDTTETAAAAYNKSVATESAEKAFESKITTQQNAFEGKLNADQAEFESNLMADNTSYKNNLTARQDCFETNLNADIASYKDGVDNSIAEVAATAIAAKSTAEAIDGKATAALTKSAEAVVTADEANVTAEDALKRVIEGQGTIVKVNSQRVGEWNADSKIDVSKQNIANGVATLDGSARLVQRAIYDSNGNIISNHYLAKNNGMISGYLALGDANSKITRNSVSPQGNNIGATGVMLTHYASDEGGLLVTEDGAYLWNSTDSGSLLKGLDEDSWGFNTGAKKDCTFASGLLFDFDSSGNLKLKGKLYQDSGENTISGQVLWTGQSSSIDPATFSFSDWKTRFSAILVSTSGTISTTFTVPIKGQTSNIRVGAVSANFQADYSITMYNFDITIPIAVGNLYMGQKYISWQSNTKTWAVSTSSLIINRIVGVI